MHENSSRYIHHCDHSFLRCTFLFTGMFTMPHDDWTRFGLRRGFFWEQHQFGHLVFDDYSLFAYPLFISSPHYFLFPRIGQEIKICAILKFFLGYFFLFYRRGTAICLGFVKVSLHLINKPIPITTKAQRLDRWFSRSHYTRSMGILFLYTAEAQRFVNC